MPSFTDDLNSLHNPATNTSPSATFGDAIRDNFQCIERVIHSQTLGSANATISSGTLPTVTNGWLLKVLFRGQLTSGTGIDVGLRFNGDSGANYLRQYLFGNNTTVTAGASTGATSAFIATVSSDSASRWQNAEAIIFDYLGSGHKAGMARFFDQRNASTTMIILQEGFQWSSTAAITSLSLVAASSTFVAGSQLVVTATPTL